MHRILPSFLVLCFVIASAQGQTTAQQASTSTVSAPSEKDILKGLRTDVQSSRADIVAKNMTLTAEQAAKFWPAFDAYQKEQNAIMDEHLKAVKKYVDSFETLDDAAALGLINAHFARDAKMDALRKKWLAQFQKVVPTRLAVRAIQIDRRLALATQMELAGSIPLVH
jgi:Spy/CpxP family protein refolding chaperone